MTSNSLWILVAVLGTAPEPNSTTPNLRVGESPAGDGATSLAEKAGGTAGYTTAEKNRQMYNGVAKAMNTFVSDAKTRRSNALGQFNSIFADQASQMQDELGKAQRAFQASEQDFKQVKSKVERKLNNLQPQASRASIHAHGAIKDYEAHVAKVEADFDQETLEMAQKWQAEETKIQEHMVNSALTTMDKAQKHSLQYGSAASKISAAAEKQQIKMELGADQAQGKFEEKMDTLANKFEGKQENIDEAWTRMESLFEALYDRQDQVYNSPDPNKGKMGLNTAVEIANEILEETKESMLEHVEEFGEDGTTTLEDTEDLQNEILEDAADKLRDHAEDLAYNNEVTKRALEMSFKMARSRNNINIAALADRVVDYRHAVQRVANVLERAEQGANKQWKDVLFQMESKQSQAQQALVKQDGEKTAEFNKKAAGIFDYLHNLKHSALTDLKSKIADVKTGAMQTIKGVSEEAQSTVAAAQGTINTAGEVLEQAQQKAEKMKTKMTEMDRNVKELKAMKRPMMKNVASVVDKESTAHSNVENIRGETLAQFQQSAYVAQRDINGMNDAAAARIQDTSKELAAMLAGVGKKANDDLNAFLDGSYQESAAVKGEIYANGERTKAIEAFWDKNVAELNKFANYIANNIPEVGEQMQSLGFEAASLGKDLEQPTREKVHAALERSKAMIEGAEQNVLSQMDKSGLRTNQQLSDARGKFNETQQVVTEARKKRLGAELYVQNLFAEFQKDLADQASKAGLVNEDLASLLMNTMMNMQNTQQRYANIFDTSSSTTNQKTVEAINAFKQAAAAGRITYEQAMLANAAELDKMDAGLRQNIKKETMVDNANFGGEIRGIEGQLSGAREGEEMLKNVLGDTRGSEATDAALQNFKHATAASEQLMKVILGLGEHNAELGEKVHAMMANATSDNDEEREALRKTLNQRIGGIDSGFKAKAAKFSAALHATSGNLALMENGLLGKIAASNQNMTADERKLFENSGELSRHIAAEERAAKMMYGQKLLAIDQQIHRQEGNIAADMAYVKNAVDEGIQHEDMLIDSDAMRTERDSEKMLDRMDPSQQSKGMVDSLALLKGEYSAEEAAALKAEMEAAAKAKQLDAAGTEVEQAGMKALTAKVPLVTKIQKLGEQVLDRLQAKVQEHVLKINGHVQDTNELATDIQYAFQGVAEERNQSVHAMAEEVAHLEALLEYQGAEALQGITTALEEEVANEQGSEQVVFGEVQPKTFEFHKRMGQVFSDMGFELNLGAVDAMANGTMQNELSERERLMNAQKGLEEVMHRVGRETKQALDAMYRKTAAEIEEVERMAHLSEQEKAMKIREIKQRARREMQELMAKANGQIKAEMHTKHNIGQKNEEIETLLARAHQLSSGQLSELTAQMLKAERAKVKGRLQDLYDKYVSPSGTSFLETGPTPAAEFDDAERYVQSSCARAHAEAQQWERELSAWL